MAVTHIPAACMEQGFLDSLCPSNVHHRHHTAETIVGERGEMTSCLEHTPVSRMSKDMVQPCRHFNKLAGLEDTFSTGIQSKADIFTLVRKDQHNCTSCERKSPHHGLHCPFFGFRSHAAIRIQTQQLKKEDLNCSVCKAFSSAQ